jgi:iron-sulfur cluster assembly protein
MELSDAAAERVRKLVEKAGGKAVGLRVGVRNGGCAGMSYTVEMAEEARPGESVVEDKGVKVLIDPKAVLFLIGAKMDFAVTKLSATFTFQNPNETASCGCGESVSLAEAAPELVREFSA